MIIFSCHCNIVFLDKLISKKFIIIIIAIQNISNSITFFLITVHLFLLNIVMLIITKSSVFTIPMFTGFLFIPCFLLCKLPFFIFLCLAFVYILNHLFDLFIISLGVPFTVQYKIVCIPFFVIYNFDLIHSFAPFVLLSTTFTRHVAEWKSRAEAKRLLTEMEWSGINALLNFDTLGKLA